MPRETIAYALHTLMIKSLQRFPGLIPLIGTCEEALSYIAREINGVPFENPASPQSVPVQNRMSNILDTAMTAIDVIAVPDWFSGPWDKRFLFLKEMERGRA